MNNYNLIMKLKTKMQDPRFASRFNKIVAEFNSIPGMQQEVMRIAQIKKKKKRDKELSRLPHKIKGLVKELMSLLED